MLHVFKPLPVVREVHALLALPPRAFDFRRDTLTLGWEERLRARGRRRSDGGAEFGTVLPRGTVLRAGNCLIVDDLTVIVTIVERPEAVFVITPASPAESAAFGYHVGNSHQPLMVTDDALLCPDVPGMEQVLRHHGIPFTRDQRAFTPMSVNGEPYLASHRHSPSAEVRANR